LGRFYFFLETKNPQVKAKVMSTVHGAILIKIFEFIKASPSVEDISKLDYRGPK